MTAAMKLCLALWGVSIAAGFAAWERYDATPGPCASEPPAGSASGFRFEVVLYLHPRCPCSRATLTEFEEIVRGAGPDVVRRVVFVCPPGTPPGWAEGDLWSRAVDIPGVVVTRDAGGEASRAGVTTAGDVIVRDAAGRVVFHGGLTRARGRGGECPGTRAIRALLVGAEPESRQTAVFGCPLFDACDRDKQTGSQGDSGCRK